VSAKHGEKEDPFDCIDRSFASGSALVDTKGAVFTVELCRDVMSEIMNRIPPPPEPPTYWQVVKSIRTFFPEAYAPRRWPVLAFYLRCAFRDMEEGRWG
jgi:hypothetical protein